MKRILLCRKSIENIHTIINCEAIASIDANDSDDESIFITLIPDAIYKINPEVYKGTIEHMNKFLAMGGDNESLSILAKGKQ